MEDYNLDEWIKAGIIDKATFNIENDTTEVNNIKLIRPGTFYILEYINSKATKIYNLQPIIFYLQPDKKGDYIYGIDIMYLNKDILDKFIIEIYKIFGKEITDYIDKFTTNDMTSEQKNGLSNVDIDSIRKIINTFKVGGATKKYIVKNIKKIYQINYAYIYKLLSSNFSDTNTFTNGNITDARKIALDKMIDESFK